MERTKQLTDCQFDNSKTIEISTVDETWTLGRVVGGNIIIKPNRTLTITCKVSMPKDGKIIVERGGKLIVDGGMLTNSCGDMWEGINVEGTYGVSQYTTVAQGWVEIKNGAIIENAKNAISTKRDNGGGVDYGYTGGIVQCTYSTFRNNRRSAEFLTFHNPSDVSNRSYFENCTFEITEPLKDPTVVPSAFISMWDVKGVQVRGNTFTCQVASGYTGTNRGKGVSTLNALYNINRAGTVGNTFTTLDMAVEQGSSAPIYSLGVNYITGNTFNDNRHGVYISGTGNPPYINENNFFRPSPAIISPPNYGVYSTGASGITIGCNIFSYLTYGNLILTTGTTSDPASLVIGNVFTENYRGIQTQNSNTNLQINYNDFTKSTVTQMHWYNLGPIATQGAKLAPAGNRFLGSPPPNDIWNNSSFNLLTYYYNVITDPDTYPNPVINVTRSSTGIAWLPTPWCNTGGEEEGLMAGGSPEQNLLLETQGEPLNEEEAILAEINHHLHTAGLDTNPSEAIQYLLSLDNEPSRWMLVPYYIMQNNNEEAAEVLGSLHAHNANQATQLNYYTTINNAGLDGRNLSQLDSTEVATLDIIAESNSDVRDNARSVLQFFYGRTYPIEEIVVSDIPLDFAPPLADGLLIPNVISPNGDGINDVFLIENLPEHSTLTIYSAGGLQVYHSGYYQNNWPLHNVDAGRYYFSLTLSDGSAVNSYLDVVY